MSNRKHAAGMNLPSASQNTLINALKQRISRLERVRHPIDGESVSSGVEALDDLLPKRGFPWGVLVEWLASGEGDGCQMLAFRTAREACRSGQAMVVLDQSREFYPPAAAELGISLEDVIILRPGNRADDTWALDQALRCPAVAVVLARPENLDGHTFRRLQLAAEQGGSLGLLLRPASVRSEPSWADVRLLVEPLPLATAASGRRLRIQLLRSRGGTSGGSVEVEIDDETRTLHPATRLAHPANHRRAAGA